MLISYEICPFGSEQRIEAELCILVAAQGEINACLMLCGSMPPCHIYACHKSVVINMIYFYDTEYSMCQ